MPRGFLISVLLTLNPALAQMNMPGHMMEMQDELPPEKLPPPQHLNGIGNSHLQITATPEAQVWFDQGLNLLHDFWDYESARAFEQAIRTDPQCAMCYWGLFKAESFYHSTAQGYAQQALARAKALKQHVTERERLYIEGTPAQIVARFPDDIQARIFLANTSDDSATALEEFLKEHPEDSAANHYLIHALEGTPHPERALPSADILARLAPNAGHMVHMPGHIYFRLGDYNRAAQSFAASMAVDERYMREQRIEPDNNWNYVHNLMYSIANLLEQGRFKEATALSTRLTGARGKLETTLYINSARDSMSRLHPELPVALRTANFRQMLKLLKSRKAEGNLELLRTALTDYARGMQAIASGHVKRAIQAAARLEEAARTQPEAAQQPATPRKLVVMPDALLRPILRNLSIMSLELRASIQAAQGNSKEAQSLFAAAAAEQKALGYREPPHYIRPAAETEAAAMLATKNWPQAKAAYERALLERPHSGFALYGIAFASEQAGDTITARQTYQDFLAAWNNADPNLPQSAHARQWLSSHRP